MHGVKLENKDALIKNLIEYFNRKGLIVKFAKSTGFETPKAIRNHEPDVLAFDTELSLVHIGLAKDCSELGDKATLEQFYEFSRRLMKTGKSEKTKVPFVISVPTECKTKIKDTFEENSIQWKENISIISI